MATSTRTKVDQDMSRHALGHIYAKLNAPRRSRTTFVLVEGADDLAFYRRFFDRRVTSVYYSTKLDDEGSVKDGGCVELQNIVDTVLRDGRTDKVVGIMDVDYRRYMRGYEYPTNVFHTDHRDMEMTALSTPSVKQSLKKWIVDYDNQLERLKPILRHAGTLRVLNDIYKLGCSFKKKVKISCVYDDTSHSICPDWKKRYNKKFRDACLKNKKRTGVDRVVIICSFGLALLHKAVHSYRQENFYDIGQGHDVIGLLSKSLVKNSIYSEESIWMRCFDAYTIADFKRTGLYASLHDWESGKGLSLIKKG